MYYKAYICDELGDINKLKLANITKTSLKKNQLRVKIIAIGLNYVDYLMIQGSYQYKNKMPFIPGTEACGIIVEEKCNNNNLINKKVIINTKNGCFSEEIIVNEKQIIIIKNNFSIINASSFFSSALTSYVSLVETIKIKKNNYIMITGASGAIGQSSIQLAKHLGAQVIAIVGNNNKKKIIRKLGVKYVLTKDENLYDKIMKITNNYGVDIILDINGFLKQYNILKCIKWNGIYLIVGFADNNITSINTNYILINGLKVFGIRSGEYYRSKTKALKNSIVKKIFKLYHDGVFDIKFYNIKKFNYIIKGLTLIKDRRTAGKIIIKTKHFSDYVK